MNAQELSDTFDEWRIPNDPFVCDVLRAFRTYLSEKVIERRGIVGFIVKIGLREAVRLLDDYLAANCGINLNP